MVYIDEKAVFFYGKSPFLCTKTRARPYTKKITEKLCVLPVKSLLFAVFYGRMSYNQYF